MQATFAMMSVEPPAEVALLHGFVRRLLDRYERLRGGASELADVLESLRLGEALLRLAGLREPASIVVLGPTQTGKSTVVNLLLERPVAGVSPLAGFTVHAQGFTALHDDALAELQSQAFAGYAELSMRDLTRDRLDAYSLTRVASGGLASRAVVWDTPDFDSLAAASYRRAILEAAALADVLVVVSSKEKYGDLALWRVLQLIEPLGRPVVLCVNKMTNDAREAVLQSLRERLRQQTPALADARIEMIDYAADLAEASPMRDGLQDGADAATHGAALRAQVIAALDARDRSHAGIAAYLRRHWDAWLAPVEAELAAERAWRQMVEDAAGTALDDYRRDFLDHPTRYDSFRHALLKLLKLLELPGLSSTASVVRDTVTFPVRWLFTRGREWWAQSATPQTPAIANEELVLREATQRMLTTLERDARRRGDADETATHMWRTIAGRLAESSDALRGGFAEEAREQRARFEPEIAAAADRIHEALRKTPAVLNTLRGTRAAAELASVALAVKTAGLHAESLLLAPAMLALTTLLTEGALGGVLGTMQADLKKRQLEHVRREIFDGASMVRLRGLPLCADGGDAAIQRDEIAAAESALQAWEQSAA